MIGSTGLFDSTDEVPGYHLNGCVPVPASNALRRGVTPSRRTPHVRGLARRASEFQHPHLHSVAVWNASLKRWPPKNNRERTWIPCVLVAGPGTISTVAGENGTLEFTDPRVATVAH